MQVFSKKTRKISSCLNKKQLGWRWLTGIGLFGLFALLNLKAEVQLSKAELESTATPVIAAAFSQTQLLFVNDGSSTSQLGWTVSVTADGNTVIAGAPTTTNGNINGQGAAYIFTRSNAIAPYNPPQKIVAPDTVAFDRFGWAVAISADGTTLAVSARSTVNSNVGQGAVYVFTRNNLTSSYSQTQKLLANDGAANDTFGYSVALSDNGNTLLIGANTKNSFQGAAYVFTRTTIGNNYNQAQKLLANDGIGGDYFGYSVALSGNGNSALVGATFKTVGGNSGQGAAYVFTRTNISNAYSQTQKLTANDGLSGDNFGYSVALSGDGNTTLIGANNKTIGANSKQGAAYIFRYSNSTYSQTQRLTALDGTTTNNFGGSVKLSLTGKTALIGALNTPPNGAAYMFDQNETNNVYTQTQKFFDSQGASGDAFGIAVGMATNGKTVLIGSAGKATGVSGSIGAVYHFSTCDELLVITSTDDGQASSCGTFSYALSQATSGNSITFVLTQSNSITFTGSLTPTVPAGVTINGGANGIILNGNGVAGDGLRLNGNNTLKNLTVRRFGGRELVVNSGGNKLWYVKIES